MRAYKTEITAQLKSPLCSRDRLREYSKKYKIYGIRDRLLEASRDRLREYKIYARGPQLFRNHVNDFENLIGISQEPRNLKESESES